MLMNYLIFEVIRMGKKSSSIERIKIKISDDELEEYPFTRIADLFFYLFPAMFFIYSKGFESLAPFKLDFSFWICKLSE